MTLEFPEHPDVVFERAPLVLVLCQVKFPPILSLLTSAGVAGFQEGLRDEYPVLSPEGGAEVQLGPRGMALSEKPPVWRFSTSDTLWRVSLSTEFVALETTEYTDAAEFVGRMEQVLATGERTVHPEASTRFGLRKVNDIEHDEVQGPRDWPGLLRGELLGLLAAQLPGTISLAFSDTRLEDGDETLAIRHGVLPDSPEKYRLDLDYFTERPMPIEANGELAQSLHRFSDGITGFFHWCMEERLYESLGPRPRGGSGIGGR